MHAWREVARLPRAMWIMFAATLINRAGCMVLPFLALYLTKAHGLSADAAAGVLAAYGVGALLMAPLAGRWADRLGAARVMKGALVSSAAAYLVFPLAHSLPALVLCTLWVSVSAEAYRPAAMAILADLAPLHARKSAYALNRLAINLGMSVGPALAGVLVAWSFSSIFVINGVCALLSAYVLWRWRLGAGTSAVAARESTGAPRSGAAWRDRTFLVFLGANLLSALVFFQGDGALPLHMVNNLALSESHYGLVFTLNTLIIVVVEVPLNGMMSRWPHRWSMALGAFLVAAGFGGLAVVHSGLGVALTVVVWTFGEMILLPTQSAFVAELAPPSRRGEYMGLFSMTWGAAFALGPALGVMGLTRLGPWALWVMVGGVGLLAALALWWVPAPAKAGTGDFVASAGSAEGASA